MAQQPISGATTQNWWNSSGLRQIFRTPNLAVHPTKLAIALGAIILTCLWGWALDLIWVRGGGIEPDAIVKFVVTRDAGQPYVEGKGNSGPFAVWRDHELTCMDGFLRSMVGRLLPGESSGSTMLQREAMGVMPACFGLGSGCWWMMRTHPLFFILFMGGALVLWSYFGGAICRVAAVHIAKEEKLTISQGLAYGRKRLFGGFFLAPCVPLGFALVTVILLMLGGVVLRAPVVGDFLCGLAFPLAIIGGFVAAILLVGLLLGGSLFWPAVAAEGSDGFDAFSRGLSYFLGRPWKSIIYGIVLTILAGISWIIANSFAGFALKITHKAVEWGAGVVGWEPLGNKLDGIWPRVPGLGYSWPPGPLSWYEWFSAACIAICVSMVIALVWSFLASYYFTGSTVVYFLLRKDVDGTDMDEVIADDTSGETFGTSETVESGAGEVTSPRSQDS
ncbi:MAG: hypothetical protein HY287_04575 [Planctomycetes bacterium]|nr:hypothetical protein [Planctomycetota bacterium]MBI3833589.1 hypothetical protein [Planctomycetota bacterium]